MKRQSESYLRYLQQARERAHKPALEQKRDLAAQLAREETKARITLPRVKFLERE